MSTPGVPLREALSDYLALRRALGFRLHNAARLLGQFLDYLEQHDLHDVSTEHALAWAMLPTQSSRHWQAIRISVVRGFAAYLHGIDPRRRGPARRADQLRAVPGHPLPVFRGRDRRPG